MTLTNHVPDVPSAAGRPNGDQPTVTHPHALPKHDPRSLLDMINEMPSSDDIEFDPLPIVIELQQIDFDSDH